MTDADTAYDLLSDPVRLPDYVPTLRLDDSTAVEGDLDLDADPKARDRALRARFSADRASHRIEWGRPSPHYGGTIAISGGSPNSSSVTLSLHTPDHADEAEVARDFEQVISNMRRLLSGR